MERTRRLQSLWSWLPTFRAVAEHESVSRAAEQLAVSPSAVSRMIGLLERDIGEPLFTRTGRRLELNESGRHLLAGTRSAMRLVDESLAVLAGAQMVGRVRIASIEPVTRALVLPTLASLRAQHPALVPELVRVDDGEVAGALLRGDLDVAFTARLPGAPQPQLSVRRIAKLATSVYVGKKHPLRDMPNLRLRDVLGHPFVAVHGDAGSGGFWPTTMRRQVVLRVDTCDLAAEEAGRGALCVALPDLAAEHHNATHRAKLTRLGLRGPQPLELHALWRRQLDLPGRAEVLVEAVAARAE